jgi:hypothetical protein
MLIMITRKRARRAMAAASSSVVLPQKKNLKKLPRRGRSKRATRRSSKGKSKSNGLKLPLRGLQRLEMVAAQRIRRAKGRNQQSPIKLMQRLRSNKSSSC